MAFISMQNWLPKLSAQSGPKYRAIAHALEQAIRTGELRAGEKVPPQRALAQALGVDLTTVTRAYGLLRDSGMIEGAGRLGSFVRNDALAPRPGETISDAGMNMPPQPGFALLVDALRAGTDDLLRAGGHSPLLQYQPSGGSLHDRREAAMAFSRRGLVTSEDEIVITAGGQNALYAILGTALAPGDRLCAGRHCYPGLLALAARFGIEVVAVDGDVAGIDPDALADALAAGARAIYLTGTNDNPTTATLDLDRRAAIAALARRYGALIIEDDAYGLLPSTPLAPLAMMAPELSWHISSTSKIISPVLRVAHVKAPSAHDAWRLAGRIHETAVMAPPLNAALVTHWLRKGTIAALIAGVRAESVARQRIVARAFAEIPYAAHPEGYHLWLTLSGAASEDDLMTAIAPLGLSVVPARAFAVRKDDPLRAVRISIGGSIGHERLRSALEKVRDMLL
jgi:DNA-binding transcriptional MocR family regulator